MQICGPVFLIKLSGIAVRIITEAGDVVRQRIEPYVNDMLVIEIHGDAPFERGPGDAQILQTGQQEVVHHLILSGFRLDEFGMGIDILDQAVGIFAHLKEIGFLLRRLHGSAAVRALAVHELGFRKEGFARRAVQSLIIALVDIALLIELPEDLLDLHFVVMIRRADEFVIGSI